MANLPERCTRARRFFLSVAEIVYLPWLRRAPTSAGHSQKANSKGIPLCAHITSRGLHWRMAEYSTGQLFTHSPAWKPARGMDRSSVRHVPVSYTHLRAHETDSYLVCRLLLE